MTHSELIALIEKQTGISKKTANAIVYAFHAVIVQKVKLGVGVSVSKLGGFNRQSWAARTIKNDNINNGIPVKYASRQKLVFGSSKKDI